MQDGVKQKLQVSKNMFWKSLTESVYTHEEMWLQQSDDPSVLLESSNLRFHHSGLYKDDMTKEV